MIRFSITSNLVAKSKLQAHLQLHIRSRQVMSQLASHLSTVCFLASQAKFVLHRDIYIPMHDPQLACLRRFRHSVFLCTQGCFLSPHSSVPSQCGATMVGHYHQPKIPSLKTQTDKEKYQKKPSCRHLFSCNKDDHTTTRLFFGKTPNKINHKYLQPSL